MNHRSVARACERPLDDPPPPAQAAAVCHAAHRQQWHNATSSQPLSDARRIVATVANHAIRPIPWPSTFTLEWRNRIDQCQCFLRVIPVGTGQPDGERHASRVANQMTLAPSLGAIRGIWTGLCTAVHRADRTAVNNRSGPIDLAFAGQPIQEREVH